MFRMNKLNQVKLGLPEGVQRYAERYFFAMDFFTFCHQELEKLLQNEKNEQKQGVSLLLATRRRKKYAKWRDFFMDNFYILSGIGKNVQNEQTEPSDAWVTRRRTKVRREVKFVYSKKDKIL